MALRVYVIHPGADFATSDVYTGLVAGLQAHDGVDVYEGRIDTILTWYDTALTDGAAAGHFDLSAAPFNRQRMASAHITQHILQVWPDLVLSVSGHNYHLEDVRALRRVGFPVACLLTESPYFRDLELVMAGIYSAVFTNERRCVESFLTVNPRSYYLPHAYNADVHQPGAVDPDKVCDAFFVGSWFEERRRLLMPLAESGLHFVWKGHDMSNTPASVVKNADVVAWYRSARVNLNAHRTTTSHGDGQHIRADEAESLNPRAYEIAACGAFQLMDDARAERFDVFGDYAPTYKAGDSDDLERQTRWWLSRPGMRAEIARAMHDAVQPHSWQARAAQVLETLL